MYFTETTSSNVDLFWKHLADPLIWTFPDAIRLVCLCAKSCPTLLQPQGLKPARFLCPWDLPGKNTGVSCHFLLQGSFPGIEPMPLMSPVLAGGFCTTRATWEVRLSSQMNS